MITITGIVGTASDPRFAGRLHHLEHDDRVEILVVGEEDASRRRHVNLIGSAIVLYLLLLIY
jgi:hypothetical protein